MSKTIDFYFDYSSPFGYLASERIEELAAKHDRTIVWRPILLGAVFKVTGQAPLTQMPLKGNYSMRDFARSAKEHKITYKHPENFPIGAVAACRATLWMRDHESENISKHTTAFVHAVFQAYYVAGKDISDTDVITQLANDIGVDHALLNSAINEQPVKAALRKEVDDAIALEVFGSPMMIVDNEPFWGNDRIEQLDRWLDQGGW